jgi:hypothetical protein
VTARIGTRLGLRDVAGDRLRAGQAGRAHIVGRCSKCPPVGARSKDAYTKSRFRALVVFSTWAMIAGLTTPARKTTDIQNQLSP